MAGVHTPIVGQRKIPDDVDAGSACRADNHAHGVNSDSDFTLTITATNAENGTTVDGVASRHIQQ
jgi:hypothetical protein